MAALRPLDRIAQLLPLQRARQRVPATTRRAAGADVASSPPPPPPRANKPPPRKRERHTSWLRRGAPDAPGSPFHELGLAALERAGEGGRAPKRRNYTLLRPQEVGVAEAASLAASDDGDDDDDAVEAALAAAAALGPPPPTPQALFLDVGCGSGRFLLLLARRLRDGGLFIEGGAEEEEGQPTMRRALAEAVASAAANSGPSPPPGAPPSLLLLGVDAQPALVARANAWARALGQGEQAGARCRFVAGDAPRVVAGLLKAAAAKTSSSSPASSVVVAGASINFPDPVLMEAPEGVVVVVEAGGAAAAASAGQQQQQQQQRLRRCPALSDEFCALLGSLMPRGAPLLVQSECGRTAQALVDAVTSSGAFDVVLPPVAPPPTQAPRPRPAWCWPHNPLGVPTEREVYLAECERSGHEAPVWRALFRARGGA